MTNLSQHSIGQSLWLHGLLCCRLPQARPGEREKAKTLSFLQLYRNKLMPSIGPGPLTTLSPSQSPPPTLPAGQGPKRREAGYQQQSLTDHGIVKEELAELAALGSEADPRLPLLSGRKLRREHLPPGCNADTFPSHSDRPISGSWKLRCL